MRSFFPFHLTTPSGTLGTRTTERSQTQVGLALIVCAALVWHRAILLMSNQLWLYRQCRQHFVVMAMLKSLFFIASIFNTVFFLSRLMENL